MGAHRSWRGWAAGLTGSLCLAACAPLSQTAALAPAGFVGPRLTPEALVAADGVELPLTVWAAEDGAGRPVEPWAVIVALHGMNDYAANFAMAAPHWARHGITTYAYDQRGFGRAPHRGIWPGEALMVEDLRTALALVRDKHPRAVLAVVGESMGAATAVCAFASSAAPAADRVVLVSPAVWGWDAQPLPNRIALWSAAHLAPAYRLGTPGWINRNIKTSDNAEMMQSRLRDPKMLLATRIDSFYGAVSLMQHARDRIGQVRPPVLFLYGAHDQLIPKRAAMEAAARLKRSDQSAYYAQGWHLLTRDLQAKVVWDDIEAFVRDPGASLPSAAPPVAPARGVSAPVQLARRGSTAPQTFAAAGRP